jgi:hypothetical protein
MTDKQKNKQIKEITKILFDNHASIATWDHYNDDINYNRKNECKTVATMLYEHGCRIVEENK